MYVHLIYNPNRPGPEVRVHKAGCRDIGRDQRGMTSDDTMNVASQTEAAVEWWGDFIAEKSMDVADALGYTEFLPCTKGLPLETPAGESE